MPMADGGEGTMEALVDATGGKMQEVEVSDPLGRPLSACYGILGDGKTAVVEVAAASGLPLLAPSERKPLQTTTYGTGQLIRAALKEGVERLLIGLGGSATVDGGADWSAPWGRGFSMQTASLLALAEGASAALLKFSWESCPS